MAKKKKLSKSERRKIEKMKQKRRNQKMIIGTAFVFFLIIGVIYVVSLGNNTEEVATPNTVSDANEMSDTQISIPTASISKSATYYNYESDGVEIEYFAVKGDDGQVHVALNACDVCYQEKKGYTQIDDVMHCVNCGNEYPITSLGTENTAGGCWPSYLPITIDDDNVIIEISDLEDKQWMFK